LVDVRAVPGFAEVPYSEDPKASDTHVAGDAARRDDRPGGGQSQTSMTALRQFLTELRRTGRQKAAPLPTPMRSFDSAESTRSNVGGGQRSPLL